MVGYVPDWPLIVSVVAALAALVAVWYARLGAKAAKEGLSIQKTTFAASALADPISDDDLWVLRRVKVGVKHEWHKTRDPSKPYNVPINSLRFEGLGLADAETPENSLVFESVQRLHERELISGGSAGRPSMFVTEEGRSVLRLNSHREIEERAITVFR